MRRVNACTRAPIPCDGADSDWSLVQNLTPEELATLNELNEDDGVEEPNGAAVCLPCLAWPPTCDLYDPALRQLFHHGGRAGSNRGDS
eukprot:7203991-Pyramimonas_sp.AAC.1